MLEPFVSCEMGGSEVKWYKVAKERFSNLIAIAAHVSLIDDAKIRCNHLLAQGRFHPVEMHGERLLLCPYRRMLERMKSLADSAELVLCASRVQLAGLV